MLGLEVGECDGTYLHLPQTEWAWEWEWWVSTQALCQHLFGEYQVLYQVLRAGQLKSCATGSGVVARGEVHRQVH